MRKHDVRKWLHAILDLLPVILIPVFMIYSHRHEINGGSIQVQEKVVIDFNQNIPTQYVDYDWSNFTSFNEVTHFDVNIYDKLYFRLDPNALYGSTYYQFYNPLSNNTMYNIRTQIYTCNATDVFRLYYAHYPVDDAYTDYVGKFNIYNLTQMFGSGNEPTMEEFNSMFPQTDFDYVQSKKMLIDGDLVTYNDTDIMSQMTYQLYNSVDKYFNVGNVFHLGEVYDWFNLNIFNGNAPIYIYVVYQIVLYELIMDLLMLLYALFMWFIDMIEKLMEKPLNSVK